MDNILEILIPLAFAAVYFFGNMFSGKSKEEKDAPPLMPHRDNSNNQDEADRQRRVQEEIRRKIMERRQSAGGSRPEAVPSGQKLRDRQHEVEAGREAKLADEAAKEVARKQEEKPPTVWSQREEAEYEHDTPVFSWDAADNAYEDSIQDRLSRIEETKRKAEKLEKQAPKRHQSVSKHTTRHRRQAGGYFTGTVRQSLNDPQAARVAFIYGEVLGQPISQRKNSSVPGLIA